MTRRTSNPPSQGNAHAASPTQSAKPFLKWAGGKRQLLAQFDPYFPKKFEHYYEPFVGSGAVYFHLWNTNSIQTIAGLFDNNPELINAYEVIKNHPAELIAVLQQYQAHHSQEFYYHIRSLDRQEKRLEPVEQAARTLYLNKTCYNGLYRVNSKGHFNTPIGEYKNPRVVHAGVIGQAHAALQQAHLGVQNFREIVDIAKAGDFVYFDPPYDPLSKTANFTSYTAGSFTPQDQQALASVFTELTNHNVMCMLSNSHTEFIRGLYQKHRIEIVQAKRAVNSDPSKRGSVNEVLVLNF